MMLGKECTSEEFVVKTGYPKKLVKSRWRVFSSFLRSAVLAGFLQESLI